jgi:hypothetical protein
MQPVKYFNCPKQDSTIFFVAVVEFIRQRLSLATSSSNELVRIIFMVIVGDLLNTIRVR